MSHCWARVFPKNKKSLTVTHHAAQNNVGWEASYTFKKMLKKSSYGTALVPWTIAREFQKFFKFSAVYVVGLDDYYELVS